MNSTGQFASQMNGRGTPLYLLLYASKHPKGMEFWDKAMKGVLPMEFDFGS